MLNHLVVDPLVKKAEEMGADLTEWAKKGLLLSVGQRVQVTLEIIEEPVVQVEFVDVKYEYHLSDEDWKDLLALPWNAHWKGKELLPLLQEIREKPKEGIKLYRTDAGTFNQFLKSLRASCRLMRVSHAHRHGYGYYALFTHKSKEK